MPTYDSSYDNSPIKRVVLVDSAGQPNPFAGVSNESNLATKTIAFDGTAGKGAQGTATLFTVTGDVLVQAFATCTEDLAGASATISLGITGNATALIAATTATSIDVNMGWRDTTPSTNETLATSSTILQARNILFVVATADITDGTLNFYVLWRPLSSGASVVAA
jgi:hypothetical protein